MTPAARRWAFLIAGAGLVAFYLWGLTGPARLRQLSRPVRRHHQPRRGRADQGHRRGVRDQLRLPRVRHAGRGVHSVRRGRRGRCAAPSAQRRDRSARTRRCGRDARPPSDAVRHGGAVLRRADRPRRLVYLGAPRADSRPPAASRAGWSLATAFILIYLAGRVPGVPAGQPGGRHRRGRGGRRGRASPPIGLSADLRLGVPFLTNFLPLGNDPGAICSSAGTIPLISFVRRARSGRRRSCCIVGEFARADAADPAGGAVMHIFPFVVAAWICSSACTGSSPAATWST